MFGEGWARVTSALEIYPPGLCTPGVLPHTAYRFGRGWSVGAPPTINLEEGAPSSKGERAASDASMLPLLAIVLTAPLHSAVESGDAQRVARIIDRGANIEEPDDDKYTPLHLAAGMGSVEMATVLLDRGARVDSTDEHGETPLHIAAFVGHADVARLLIERGHPVNADSASGLPLHMAAEQGRAEVAQVLLDHGADVAATTAEGVTALHRAAHHNNPAVAAVLIQAGAPLDVKDSAGETPVTLAMGAARLGNGNVLEILKKLARHERSQRQLQEETDKHKQKVQQQQQAAQSADMGGAEVHEAFRAWFDNPRPRPKGEL